jgi:hypothetical protein
VERRRRSRLSNGDKQTRIRGPQEERVCRTERKWWWYGGVKRRENFRRPRGRSRDRTKTDLGFLLEEVEVKEKVTGTF